MTDDIPVFHPNNPRARTTGPRRLYRVLGALWPLSSCCKVHDSTPVLTPYNENENLIARPSDPPSRKDLDHFINTLDKQVLSTEDESLVRQMDSVWDSLRRRHSLSRSLSPRTQSQSPLIDHSRSFKDARAAWLDSRLTEGQKASLARSGNHARLRRIPGRKPLRPDPSVHLRGGGDGEGSGRRARTTLPPTKAKTVLSDDARPHPLLWWLAGGNISRSKTRPTIGELRVRKEVELANREMVGFWGTAARRRRVGRVTLLGASPKNEEIEGEKSAEVEETDAEEESKAEMKAWIRDLVIEQVKAMKEENAGKETAKDGEEAKNSRPAEVEDGEE